MSAQTFAPQAPAPSISAESASPPNNGRDSAGRFVKGNLGGPGNPYARHTAALRQALAACVSADEIHALGRKLYLLALDGDLAAAKLLLSYVVGKPAPPPDPDTLDAHEWSVFKGLPVAKKDVQAVLNGVQAGLACKLASIAVPALEMVQGQEFADLARRSLETPLPQDNETRRSKKARPDRPPTEANGSSAKVQTGPNTTPDHPPTEANGSNGSTVADGAKSRPSTESNGSNGGKAASGEAPGRHQTASNGPTPKKRSKWWGFGKPFRQPVNGANGQKNGREAVSR
jgi:hypothetical protein